MEAMRAWPRRSWRGRDPEAGAVPESASGRPRRHRRSRSSWILAGALLLFLALPGRSQMAEAPHWLDAGERQPAMLHARTDDMPRHATRPCATPSPATTPTVPAATPAAGASALPAADPAVAELAAMIQQSRAEAGVAQLSWSPELAAAAAWQAQDMASHGFVSHSGSDGSDIMQRIRRAGYEPRFRGEIIVQTAGGPAAAFDWWWSSSLHHDTMLGPAYRDFGVAVARSSGPRPRDYYVVVFGRR